MDDGEIEDYECCQNYNFKTLYLPYFRDLLGKGDYEKLKGTKRVIIENNEVKISVSKRNNIEEVKAGLSIIRIFQ